jgi:hypothetical protein
LLQNSGEKYAVTLRPGKFETPKKPAMISFAKLTFDMPASNDLDGQAISSRRLELHQKIDRSYSRAKQPLSPAL